MMEQQPDKLFREKLAGYTRPTSAEAWSKLEAGLNKKKFPYWRIAAAASFLLISIAAYVLWPKAGTEPRAIANNSSNTEERIKPDHSVKPETETPAGKDTSIQPIITMDTNEIQGNTESSLVNSNKKETPKSEKEASEFPTKQDIAKERVVAEAAEPMAVRDGEKEMHRIPVTEATTPSQVEPGIDETTLASTALSSDESITIVLSVEDTNEYLVKNNNTEATTPEKKTSTLKKVLKKASDLKNNDQDPIGDLRQMKNEILALNFKSEKQRGQNK